MRLIGQFLFETDDWGDPLPRQSSWGPTATASMRAMTRGWTPKKFVDPISREIIEAFLARPVESRRPRDDALEETLEKDGATKRIYRSLVSDFLGPIQKNSLTQVTPRDVLKAFEAQLGDAKVKAPGYFLREISVITGLFQVAADLSHIHASPVRPDEIKALLGKRGGWNYIPVIPSSMDITKALRLLPRATLRDRRDYIIVALCATTAILVKQLVKVRRGDVQESDGRMVIRIEAIPGTPDISIPDWVEVELRNYLKVLPYVGWNLPLLPRIKPTADGNSVFGHGVRLSTAAVWEVFDRSPLLGAKGITPRTLQTGRKMAVAQAAPGRGATQAALRLRQRRSTELWEERSIPSSVWTAIDGLLEEDDPQQRLPFERVPRRPPPIFEAVNMGEYSIVVPMGEVSPDAEVVRQIQEALLGQQREEESLLTFDFNHGAEAADSAAAGRRESSPPG